jgi:hypothetical protein
MRSRIAAGALAGLPAGVVFGAMMQLMTAPTPDGGSTPMMQMVAMVVGSDSLTVGWMYHLFNSAAIGAAFGLLFGTKTHAAGAAGWGLAWGFFWWILGGQILMPVLLGMPPFATLRMPPMRMVAIGSLVGHLAFGLILGVAFTWLRRGNEARAVGHVPA